MARAAQPLPRAQLPSVLPTESGPEVDGGIHLHFDGVNAEYVAEIIRRELP
jgi:hypothetical protein